MESLASVAKHFLVRPNVSAEMKYSSLNVVANTPLSSV